MKILASPIFPLRETHRNSTEIGAKLYEERGVHRRVTNRMSIRLDKRYTDKKSAAFFLYQKMNTTIVICPLYYP